MRDITNLNETFGKSNQCNNGKNMQLLGKITCEPYLITEPKQKLHTNTQMEYLFSPFKSTVTKQNSCVNLFKKKRSLLEDVNAINQKMSLMISQLAQDKSIKWMQKKHNRSNVEAYKDKKIIQLDNRIKKITDKIAIHQQHLTIKKKNIKLNFSESNSICRFKKQQQNYKVKQQKTYQKNYKKRQQSNQDKNYKKRQQSNYQRNQNEKYKENQQTIQNNKYQRNQQNTKYQRKQTNQNRKYQMNQLNQQSIQDKKYQMNQQTIQNRKYQMNQQTNQNRTCQMNQLNQQTNQDKKYQLNQQTNQDKKYQMNQQSNSNIIPQVLYQSTYQSNQSFIRTLQRQISLDQFFRTLKHLLYGLSEVYLQRGDPDRWAALRDLLQEQGVRLSRREVQEAFEIRQDEVDPFLSVSTHHSELMPNLVAAYIDAEDHWHCKLLHRWPMPAIALLRTLPKVMQVGDLTAYINANINSEFRNRDVAMVFRRCGKGSSMESKEFVKVFLEK